MNNPSFNDQNFLFAYISCPDAHHAKVYGEEREAVATVAVKHLRTEANGDQVFGAGQAVCSAFDDFVKAKGRTIAKNRVLSASEGNYVEFNLSEVYQDEKAIATIEMPCGGLVPPGLIARLPHLI